MKSILSLAILVASAGCAASPRYWIAYVGEEETGSRDDPESRPGRNTEIYIIDENGQNPRRVTHHPATDTEPSWSPDGRRLAFGSSRDGNDEIYVIDLKTGAETRLTHDPGLDCQPAWSPDGRHIAFVSDRRAGNWDIYVMDPDGKNVRRLTSGAGLEAQPSWSPDSGRIAFVQNSPDDKGFRRLSLYWVESSGNAQPVRMNVAEGINQWPAWRPDGNEVIFMSLRNENEDIYAVDLWTGRERRLTQAEQAEDMPSFSPDGRRLAFMIAGTEGKERFHDIVVTDAEGKSPRRLRAPGGHVFHPRWSGVPMISPR
ncbi:MAG TPA: DPP IV N-terminal domain-containing protein [Planctomycetota bacterium]|nr:DPP IV N-terminal domain-containing protein [Planctomycetota bacterium]